MEDINASELEKSSDVSLLATDDTVYTVYDVYYYDYSAYNEYSNYYDYSEYYNYYNYSVYYNYYNYSNYSNSISVTRHPISQSVQLNETVTFSVGASNTIDSCQWYVSDTPTGVGTVIPGATTPNYSFVVNRSMDNKYYYCIVRRGGNSATSSRALLTVMTVDAFDIYVAVGSSSNMFFVRANPSTTTIVSAVVSDESVAKVTSSGVITGVSLGSTICTVTGSNGAKAQFTITVLPASDILVVIFRNTAIAIREYKKISNSIYPNQMASYLRGDGSSIPYSTLADLLLDIADSIRALDNSTGHILPSSFYHRILSLTA